MVSSEPLASVANTGDPQAVEWLRCALDLDASQDPFPWQIELLRRFLQGEVVSSLDIPTGLGKTAVMAVWLVARALEGFCELCAGHAGIVSLSPVVIGERDGSLLGRSRVWRTITPYVVTRHAKRGAATGALAADLRAECSRLGLPEPGVESSNVWGAPGLGLTGNVTLQFKQSVAGPLILGRTRYLGGGLFRPVQEPDQS